MKINPKIVLELAAICILVIVFSIVPSIVTAQENKAGEVAEAVELQEPAETVVAEQVDDDDDDDDFEAVAIANPFGIDSRTLLAAKKFQLTQLFAVEVEELLSVCKLDKKQALKLRVATKGAVKKLSADWVKKNNRQMGAMGGNANANKKKKDDEEELVIEDADEIDQMTMQAITMNMFGPNPYQAEDPRESRFWKKTIASVLTIEQRDKVKTLRAEREKIKREALTDYLVQSMAVELGMGKTQTAKFDDIIRPVLASAEIDCISMYEPYLMYYYASKADETKMKELLSPAQLQEWKIFLLPSKQIGEMIEGGGNQFAQVNGGQRGFWEGVDDVATEVVEMVTSLFDSFAKKE